ncbi:MAG: DNA integrity scanning protein DisA nucleotide-binding domain protein [Polyangiaceae bacterium]|nr:DNA integrity scanning protein DisA nucleotide-binding domain protein [Polyangiaceae bacterium]
MPTTGELGAHVFPPALVPVLRHRAVSRSCCLGEVDDDLLVHLLTTVFFAGLETHEGERNPVGVVLLGRSEGDVVLPEGAESGAASLYQWKVHRFDAPRPFSIPEFAKLAVAGLDRRIYSAVHVLDEAHLAITGLAREGLNVDRDPFLKIVAARPGCLSIRNGRDLLLGYERGAILTGGEDVLFSAGPVRLALEENARAAGLEEPGVADYLDAIRSLVREMAAHGRGGILIIAPEEQPSAAESATYRMVGDSSLAALLRLARHIERRRDSAPPSRPFWPEVGSRRSSEPPQSSDARAFGELLRNAFLTEAERVVEELGALTGIDGATLLNRALALVAFGVILPVGHTATVDEALDSEGVTAQPVDLGSRGVRHRAGATYAAEHPGSVVFVASEDGQVTCMFREAVQTRVLAWRLGPGT